MCDQIFLIKEPIQWKQLKAIGFKNVIYYSGELKNHTSIILTSSPFSDNLNLILCLNWKELILNGLVVTCKIEDWNKFY